MINQTIPEFSAQAFHNGEFTTVSSEDLKGKWSVFCFYPADFTFVCPTELGDLADHYQELQDLGCEVLSVSTDTHFTHKAWHDTSDTIGKIRFPMIGDGTLGEGMLYETLNLAAIWQLPMLFVVENNGIAQTTASTQR